ncbi:poly(ADP-ribose) glycohydrolase isoform [Gregarina niphandrodes]|uniref:poly(ADP-ribose) glycohydrolase n=1 Tax=Gregarina niphandrodes TaxID=110365 RepID=A0A023B0X5_GRENI|nr:poly(ADP-ribose) glycohydrolase isoform [Gregarina niphandrodes]EZG45595.1 poly(ADP-ribose) glycohydrolase isoform [Gregarina niphandrodes]|eukprot:XP_011132471.1 poly(ADP-ribose) glycohydrolase isoform [Gregarina niphandrodes]
MLPSSPSQRCYDRFSVLDSVQEEGLVPVFALLKEILKRDILEANQLTDALDTISNSLRGTSGVAGDYGMLQTCVQEHPDFFTRTWPAICRAALQMPELFPEGGIRALDRTNTRHRLSRRQCACLIAHQFLCSLPPPPWRDGFYDFSVWYASSQRHPIAVKIYLSALFTYFDRLQEELEETSWKERRCQDGILGCVEYSLHSLSSSETCMPETWSAISLAPLRVEVVERFNTEYQECRWQEGAVVVSANKDIGFGQSATQEEVFMGNSPEACVAVLITPTLADDQVLVVRGAAPVFRISGCRRNLTASVIKGETDQEIHVDRRGGGMMLLMDALELDATSGSSSNAIGDVTDGILPDLRRGNVDREVRKAYTAFSAWGDKEYQQTVWSGLWGCGAFDGDPGIKTIVLWIAASLAGKKLCLVCDGSHDGFSQQLNCLIASSASWTVADLKKRIDNIPRTVGRMDTMRWLVQPVERLPD